MSSSQINSDIGSTTPHRYQLLCDINSEEDVRKFYEKVEKIERENNQPVAATNLVPDQQNSGAESTAWPDFFWNEEEMKAFYKKDQERKANQLQTATSNEAERTAVFNEVSDKSCLVNEVSDKPCSVNGDKFGRVTGLQRPILVNVVFYSLVLS